MKPSFDAYVESFIKASSALDRSAQSQLAQEFFREVSSLHLALPDSYEAWGQILLRRAALTKEASPEPPLRRAYLEYFLHSPYIQEPVITEFAELQRLKASSTEDPLTGVENRRFFDDRLEQEIGGAVRYAQELSLVLMDLNRFKEVNDTHGHATGDKLLAMAGALLAESARSTDWAFRIGGDEFALLLSQTPSAGAETLAERIRQRFSEVVKPLELQVPVSFAYGVSTAPREAKEPKDLFVLADQRLYNFKRSIGSPRCAPRSSPRIPLAHGGAYAILRWGSGAHRASVLDFSFGGVGLQLPTPVKVPSSFVSQLHLPPLQACVAWVHKVYEFIDSNNVQRLGCSFLEPGQDQPPTK